ncbi:MAG: type II toxin-antitoxin system HicB family antitoxin [Candidatus Omnitrophota bacterium]
MKYQVIIERDEDGIYVGRAAELRGCVSQGDTVVELLSNMKEAIELYLEAHPRFLNIC